MSHSILNLRHYNTPGAHESEGIVQSNSNVGYQLDRFPNHEYHYRHRHRFYPAPESVAYHRGSRDYNRCSERYRGFRLMHPVPVRYVANGSLEGALRIAIPSMLLFPIQLEH